MNTAQPGILYLVPTPIGNLGDITLRALEIFKERPRLSFADSALFAYAGLHGAEHIASFDREFKKVPGAKIVC